jgi:hypothetical protein
MLGVAASMSGGCGRRHLAKLLPATAHVRRRLHRDPLRDAVSILRRTVLPVTIAPSSSPSAEVAAFAPTAQVGTATTALGSV